MRCCTFLHWFWVDRHTLQDRQRLHRCSRFYDNNLRCISWTRRAGSSCIDTKNTKVQIPQSVLTRNRCCNSFVRLQVSALVPSRRTLNMHGGYDRSLQRTGLRAVWLYQWKLGHAQQKCDRVIRAWKACSRFYALAWLDSHARTGKSEPICVPVQCAENIVHRCSATHCVKNRISSHAQACRTIGLVQRQTKFLQQSRCKF